MEAGKSRRHRRGRDTIGLAAARAAPNEYVTPALRKMHFLLLARAVAVFPGGFGTFDEAFELLTLIQTKKVKPLPILFFGREFWEKVINFQALVDEGVIAPADLDLFTFCETAEDAWDCVCRHYAGMAEDLGCRGPGPTGRSPCQPEEPNFRSMGGVGGRTLRRPRSTRSTCRPHSVPGPRCYGHPSAEAGASAATGEQLRYLAATGVTRE